MMENIIVVVMIAFIWSSLCSFLAYHWYLVCRRKSKGCRNIDCKKGREYPYNELYKN